MPEKLDRCVKQVMSEGKSEESAYAICNASFKDEAIFQVSFTDTAVYDADRKKLVSVRDGVQMYYGFELGVEPREDKFQVFRAKDTIQNIVELMPGLPITLGHVPLGDQKPIDAIGKVLDAELVDGVDENTKSTVKIKNRVDMSEIPYDNELSLGYYADLVPCELYDFEQVDIVPHHLAVVKRGRCGDVCKFTDQGDQDMHKKEELNKAFTDADGQVNMQQILELVADLPEAIKKMDIKSLGKFVPVLQRAMEAAGVMEAAEGGEEVAHGGDVPPADNPLEAEAPAAAAEVEDAPETEEEMKKKEMADAKAFSDSVMAATKKETARYASVMVKAQGFLPKDYKFADKCSMDIMRDALALHHTEKFEDSELSTAFKLLKKTVDYSQFGDSKPGSLSQLKDKEI